MGSLFGAAKTVSVDPVITRYRYIRANEGKELPQDKIDELSSQDKISGLDKKILQSPESPPTPAEEHKGLIVNIYEAGITEYKNDLKDNAMCAHALCESLVAEPPASSYTKTKAIPKTIDIKKDAFYNSLGNENNYLSVTHFSQEWASLYETWNLAFVLSELDNLEVLMPKLLIPSVVAAEKENYMATRVLALWFSINTFIFRMLDDIPSVKGPANKKEMAEAWGAINKKYAYELAQSAGKNSEELDKSFNSFFDWPTINFLKLLKDL